MSIESPADWRGLREVGRVTRIVLDALEVHVRAGITTGERDLAGHGVGRTIHEEPSVPNDYVPWQRDILTEGLVLTIEPMISAGSADHVQDADGWTLRTSDGSLAAHYEHSLVTTRGGLVLLTAA